MALPHSTDPVGESRAVLRWCIHALMGANHVSQTDLSRFLGIGQGQLSKRLKGTLNFDEDELAKVATYFSVELPDLWQPDRVLRSRCFSLVPPIDGQMEFSFLDPPPLSVAV